MSIEKLETLNWFLQLQRSERWASVAHEWLWKLRSKSLPSRVANRFPSTSYGNYVLSSRRFKPDRRQRRQRNPSRILLAVTGNCFGIDALNNSEATPAVGHCVSVEDLLVLAGAR